MTVTVVLNERDLKKLILKDLSNKVGFDLKESDIDILVKSKQNYRSEWESASFKAIYNSSSLGE